MASKRPSTSTARDTSTPKRTRKSLTLEQKLEILDRVDKGQKTSVIVGALKMPESTIRTVKQNASKIRAAAKAGTPLQSSVAAYSRPEEMQRMEKMLATWIEHQNKSHIPINLALIQTKAKSIYDSIEAENKKPFGASSGWFAKFRKRFRFNNLKMVGEAASADWQTAEDDFPATTIIEDGEYSSKQAFNIDESGLYWKKLPNKTFISVEESTVANLSECMIHIQQALNIIEENDPNVERSSKVIKGVIDQVACYNLLLREKQQKAKQSIISFFRHKSHPSSATETDTDQDDPVPTAHTPHDTDVPFQLSTKQNKKMMKMMPLLQTDSYSQKWPDIGDNSTTLPSTFCSSSITDIASNLSAIDDNLLSMRPKFLSVSSEYRCMLMTNLALFWKNGQYCDATLEAANSKIYVHKLLLLAISPKLQFKVKVPFSSFLRVIFPQGVDLAGLNAFADYMYHGILTLDQGLVAQLQTIAQQLNIEELDLLCKNQLISSDPKSYSEKSDFSASSNFPDVSILFTDANFHIKKESSDSLDYLTDSFEPVSINQTFPSENAIDHIQDIEDNLLSNHFQNPQATENFFEKKLPSLSQMTDPHDSTFINNTEFKNCANII